MYSYYYYASSIIVLITALIIKLIIIISINGCIQTVSAAVSQQTAGRSLRLQLCSRLIWINVASTITKMRPLYVIVAFAAVASSGVLLAMVLYFILTTTVT